MVKDIVLKDVPDDKYWEWKRQKSDEGYSSWKDFFMDKLGGEDGS